MMHEPGVQNRRRGAGLALQEARTQVRGVVGAANHARAQRRGFGRVDAGRARRRRHVRELYHRHAAASAGPRLAPATQPAAGASVKGR